MELPFQASKDFWISRQLYSLAAEPQNNFDPEEGQWKRTMEDDTRFVLSRYPSWANFTLDHFFRLFQGFSRFGENKKRRQGYCLDNPINECTVPVVIPFNTLALLTIIKI